MSAIELLKLLGNPKKWELLGGHYYRGKGKLNGKLPHEVIQQAIVEIIQLQAELANKTKALQRSISGEAFFVGGMIPESLKSEWGCRHKFTKFVLEGKTVREAMKQAVGEQQKILDDGMAKRKSEAYRKGQIERAKELRDRADGIMEALKGNNATDGEDHN